MRPTAVNVPRPGSRVVETEWLDNLPTEDPAAVRSRRDLKLLNRILGHTGIIAPGMHTGRISKSHLRIAEIGSGDGTFLLQLARRLAWKHTPVTAHLVDRQGILNRETIEEFARANWQVESVVGDVFVWLEGIPRGERWDFIVANLFLHHFEDADLARMLALCAAHCHTFIACEPRRSRVSLLAAKAVGLIGCNAVTQHDAVVSVRAGFNGDELTRLWPSETEWLIEENASGLFSHLFRATQSKPTRAA